MRIGWRMSLTISSIAVLLRARQAEGQGGEHFAAQIAFGDEGAAGDTLHMLAHQREGKLIGEQLVESEALARQSQRRERVIALRRMHRAERLAPGKPFLLLHISGSSHSGSSGARARAASTARPRTRGVRPCVRP